MVIREISMHLFTNLLSTKCADDYFVYRDGVTVNTEGPDVDFIYETVPSSQRGRAVPVKIKLWVVLYRQSTTNLPCSLLKVLKTHYSISLEPS